MKERKKRERELKDIYTHTHIHTHTQSICMLRNVCKNMFVLRGTAVKNVKKNQTSVYKEFVKFISPMLYFSLGYKAIMIVMFIIQPGCLCSTSFLCNHLLFHLTVKLFVKTTYFLSHFCVSCAFFTL